MAYTDHHYFIDGLMRDRENVVVCAAFHEREDIRATDLWIQNEAKWMRYKFDDDSLASIAYDHLKESLVAIGKDGHAAEFHLGAGAIDPGELKNSIVRRKVQKAGRPGPFTRTRYLRGTAYACGWRGKVSRLGPQGWELCERGIPNDVRANLQDLAADGDGGIYAVGMKGAAFRMQGAKWSSVDLPTSAHLYCAASLSNGEVVMGGASGVLLQGRGDHWRSIELKDFELNIWSIEEYEGQIWIAAGDDFLGFVNSGNLVPIVPKVGVSSKSNRLSSFKDRLFSCGPQSLFLFDGNTWSEVVLPSPKVAGPRNKVNS